MPLMSHRLIPLAALLLAGTALAQRHSSPSEAAKAFTLDGLAPTPTPEPTATPTPEPSAPSPVAPAAEASDSRVVRGVFTLDTPIADLIANPAAKAVLDRDLPGMSDDSNLDKFRQLSLRGFQPLTGGQLTDAMLAKVAADLGAIAGGEAHVTAPATPGTSKRNKDDSR